MDTVATVTAGSDRETRETAVAPSLDQLPRELLLRISEYLVPPLNTAKEHSNASNSTSTSNVASHYYPRDIVRLSSACRALRFLATDNVLWKSIYARTFSPAAEALTTRSVETTSSSAAATNSGPTSTSSPVALSWHTLYKTRVDLISTSINILVPFNLGSRESSLEQVGRLWDLFLGQDNGQNGRVLASQYKLIMGLLELGTAVLESAEDDRRLGRDVWAGKPVWQTFQLLTAACLQDPHIASLAMDSSLWPLLRRMVCSQVTPLVLNPKPNSDAHANFVAAAALYVTAHVACGKYPVCTLQIPKDNTFTSMVQNVTAADASHRILPEAAKLVADPSKTWQGYYSYSVDPNWNDNGAPWDEFDGPMEHIRAIPPPNPAGSPTTTTDNSPPQSHVLKIDRRGRDAVDSFVFRGTINTLTGKCYLSKRYTSQGHGWSYNGFVTTIGCNVGIAGYWFPLGFDVLLDDDADDWDGNCGPWVLWVA